MASQIEAVKAGVLAMGYNDLACRIGRHLGFEFEDRHPTRHGRKESWTMPYCRHPEWTLGRWRRIGYLPRCTDERDMRRVLCSIRNQLRALKDLTFEHASDGFDVANAAAMTVARAFVMMLECLYPEERVEAAAAGGEEVSDG